MTDHVIQNTFEVFIDAQYRAGTEHQRTIEKILAPYVGDGLVWWCVFDGRMGESEIPLLRRVGRAGNFQQADLLVVLERLVVVGLKEDAMPFCKPFSSDGGEEPKKNLFSTMVIKCSESWPFQSLITPLSLGLPNPACDRSNGKSGALVQNAAQSNRAESPVRVASVHFHTIE